MTKENHKTKIVRIAMIISLALLIAVPVVCMDHEQGVISDIDNRRLQDFPTLDSEIDISQQIENYFSDRIGFRKEMIGAYSALNDKAFHLMTHPIYEYGTDNYVYFNFTNEEYSQDHIEAFADYIAQLQKYYIDRGIPFLYVISPEKARVYPEHVPDSIGTIPFTTDTLLDMLDERGVNYVDQGEALIEAKNDGRQVFNPMYDAGHWNSEGMYAGCEMIVERLQDMGIDIASININDYEKDYTEQTTLKSSFYPIKETTFMYYIKPDCGYASTDHSEIISEVEMDKNYHTGHFYTTPLPSGTNTLMFQGSYFNTQGMILQNEFSSLATIHDYVNVCYAPYYTDIFQPDIVIFENADYTISEAYYPYDLLVNTKLPPVLTSFDSFKTVDVTNATMSVDVDASTQVSTIRSTWPTTDTIEYLYVIVDGVVYDTSLLEDGSFKWGIMTDTLAHADSIEFVGVNTATQTKYSIMATK